MNAQSRWYEQVGKYQFFTGKGGVGKTSLACATAILLADRGKKVLLVSTDPASNLAHVFGIDIGELEPTDIPGAPGLAALNIDPEAAAQAYRDRIVGPVRGELPPSVVAKMEEELSGACTTEIAAFDEFTTLLTNPETAARYDHIIFDTAPTGHTLRMLKLPSAWSDFLDANQTGASCLGPLAGLEKQRQQYHQAVDTLADGNRTMVVLVSRPQCAALAEAARTSSELSALGVSHQRLVVNGVMPESESDDPLAQAMRRRDAEALSRLPDGLRSLPTDYVELRAMNLVGIDVLRGLLVPSSKDFRRASKTVESSKIDAPTLADLVDAIEADGHGLVMVLGKGGVGKTTIAAAVAVELASRGHDVHLTTTDPAAHVAEAIASEVEHLQVSRIDPRAETERYRQHVLSTKGKDLDEAGRALLEEDLRSPCTEEIAVFQAFSKVIREGQHKFVVMDTAPTGHTLLLLDATGSYHRDIIRHSKDPAKITTPMMRLQDPAQTKMLIVALPETTPVLEAAALQEDLRRADIEPWAWVINASLAAAGPSDPLLVARAHSEVAQIAKVKTELAKRYAITPWLATEPVGPTALRALTHHAGATVTN
ncbi:arsenical pump-driving ATPase [Lacipirellula limnantheis]|uniref:arsenite-transporting ATPase n=1 Tax=Lacipirellula limnantheis TaxID=2528024 RepID=A0A517TXX5_9BACT|nr:arsenical pump-driving ATPase [Lacipirellula limnantheis]QDT73232.1 Arsenical pump-driving ATPase [Lacipirellula limnantheis]